MLITTRTETSSQKIVVAYTKGVIEVFELEGKTKKLVCVLRTVLDNSVLSIRVHQ